MQTVPSGFNQMANGDVIPLSWGIRISFDKAYDDNITWFTLDQSTLNSGDLLAPTEDNSLQAWDFYEYQVFTERLVYMSVQKSIAFPYSVVSAIADFQLNNYDGYFTPSDPVPDPPIEKDAFSSAFNSYTNTLTWSHTCSGTDRLLIVGAVLLGDSPPAHDIVSLTYNGVSMSKLTYENDTGIHVEMWYMVNPPQGAHNIVITHDGTFTTSWCLGMATSFTGVDQSNPVDVYDTDESATNAMSVSLTTTGNNYVIFDVGGKYNTDDTLVPDSGQTADIRDTVAAGWGLVGAMSTKPAPTDGTFTTGYTWTDGNDGAMIALALRQAINPSPAIGQYILPKRPVRLLLGLSNVLLPQFVGLTKGMPEIGRVEGTATFTAMDFLTWIYDMDIRETIAMQNVRTDQVLANIFTQFGLAPSQYDLAVGRNTIPFLFFEKDQVKAGDIIRPLMQAEMGRLWLDEQGIIRFTPRLEQPTDPVYFLDEDNIEDIEHSGDDEIINRVVINTWVREVQEYQSVYSKSKTDTSLNVIPANSTYVFEASLQDPALTIEDPVSGENAGVSWFTAATPDGVPVTTNVSVDSTELKTNSFNITFNNTNNFAVNIDQLFLWGQPAKNITVEPVIYENKDTDSIAKYEEQTYEITNNFIQDIDDARSLALTMLDEYSEHADIVTVTMSKPNPALQLADIIDIDYGDYSGEYRIIAMNIKLQDAKMPQVLTCRKYTPRHWFTLSQSVLDGTDVLAP